MKHIMRLHKKPFKQISSGIKTIESRLYDEKRRIIKIGDEIEFVSRENQARVLVEVTNLRICTSFKELFNLLPPQYFGAKDDEELYSIYSYYNVGDEQKYGVVGIEFRKI